MRRLLNFVLQSALALTMAAQMNFGENSLFNGDWEFRLGKGPWREVTLPHDWSIEATPSQEYASCQGYLPGGVGTYRKTFDLKDIPKADSLYIYFEGVYNRSEVRLNGKLLGKRPNGYASFLYNMTPYLKKGKNVLEVKVDHSRQADSRWYTGSGIYRDTWLVAADKDHFAQWGTGYTAEITPAGEGVVSVFYDTVGPSEDLDVVVTIRDGEYIVATGTNPTELIIPKLRPWSIDDPYLYNLSFELVRDGEIIDRSDMRMGVRNLDFDADNGFYLNGQNIKVKGVCLHHDAGVLGAVVPREVWYRRVQELKKMGANGIRMSHNPQSPDLYDVCDELGMLVIDEASDEWEFPKRKWVEGWNQGEPAFEGTYDFFEEWIDRDVADMVRRDRNHPCVFMWSIGNEVDYPNDPYSHPVLDGDNAGINQPMFGGYDPKAPNAERIGHIAKRLSEVVKQHDTSRPTTGALAGVVMSNQTIYPQSVDVVGYNYTENRYAEDHETYPDRILYGSETGVGYDAWLAVRDNPNIFGQFVWTGTDYLGESGRWPSRGLGTGLLDFASFLKPRGWMRKAMWSDEPMIYAGAFPMNKERMRRWMQNEEDIEKFVSPDAPDVWNYKEGDTVRVMCYTNLPVVRLKQDGKVIGTKGRNDETGITYFDVVYSPGNITAEGCAVDGKVLATYSINTTSEPAILHASLLDPYADVQMHQVLIEVFDKDGNLVKHADDQMEVTIEGPGTLIGLENGDNRDMSQHRRPTSKVSTGRVVAYVQRDGEGPITLKANLNGCKGTEITMHPGLW